MPIGRPGSTPACSVSGCHALSRRHGLCVKHDYEHNRPDPKRAKRLRQKFVKENRVYVRRSRRLERNRYYKACKDACYNAYGGYVCYCCGVTDPLFLTLDHVRNDGGKFRSKNFGGSGLYLYRWLIKRNFPAGVVQVSCYNCNCGRARNGGVCPHKRSTIK